MKSCPTCRRTYPDDTLAFCLVDGSVLSAPFDPQPDFRHTNPPPTEVLRTPLRSPDTIATPPLQPTMPNFLPGYGAPAQATLTGNRSSIPWIVLALALLFLFVVGVAVLIYVRPWPNIPNKTAQKSEVAPDLSTPAETLPSPTPENSPSPLKVDISGTWMGITDNDAATLVIDQSESDSYEGTEIITAAVRIKIAVEVQVDPASRRVTLREKRLLTGDGYWNLGVNTGSLSPDGQRMGGKAKDVKGKVYAWSFTRQ